MRKIITRICLLLLFPMMFIGQATAQNLIFELEKDDVKPGFIAARKVYSDSTLYGPLNGGADLYREYGIRRLIRQEIVFRSLYFKVDIYDFADPAAAFGVYQLHVHQCQTRDSIAAYDCLNPKQVQFVWGTRYVSITNVRGDSLARASGIELARRLIKKAGFYSFVAPPIFRSKLLSPYLSNLKVFFGPVGLQNGYPDWSERFSVVDNYQIHMLPVTDSAGTVEFARIIFRDTGDIMTFAGNMRLPCGDQDYFCEYADGDLKRALIILTENNCLFLETRGKNNLTEAMAEAFRQVGEKAGLPQPAEPQQPVSPE